MPVSQKLQSEKYNSPDLDDEEILNYLTQGRRTPQNAYERQLLKEINEIESRGGVVEIPFNAL